MNSYHAGRIMSYGAAALLAMATSPIFGGTLFVHDQATGQNNGTSWTDSFIHLQDALAVAQSGDSVWVARGTYRPDQGAGMTAGDRSATFQLRSDVALYGGFAGIESTLEDRQGLFDQTVLSGDLAGDDVPGFLSHGENSMHVVTALDAAATAVLDGFLIRGGSASPIPITGGGGLYVEGGAPTLARLTVTDNCGKAKGSRGGGGMLAVHGSPSLTDCSFVKNRTEFEGGGGLCLVDSGAALTRCSFKQNESLGGLYYVPVGGGLLVVGGSPTLTDCEFVGHGLSNGYGAAVFNSGDARFVRCTFRENAAGTFGYGGAISSHNGDPTFVDCLFSGNSAQDGGAISTSGTFDPGSVVLLGCTFVGNAATGATGSGGAASFTANTNVILRRCRLLGNAATSSASSSAAAGGALYHYGFFGSLTLEDCVLVGNQAVGTAVGRGGAVYVSSSSSSSVTFTLEATRCSFVGNAGNTHAGGVYIGNGAATLTGCVFWGNAAAGTTDEAAQIAFFSAPPTVDFSCVQGWTGGLGGSGNHSHDPLLVDPDGPDDLLGTIDDDVRLSPGSTGIDAGGPSGDLCGVDAAGAPRVLDGDLDLTAVVDMGAIEFSNVHLDVSGTATPGGTLTLTTTGTPGLDAFLFVSLFAGQACAPLYGLLFLDLAAPFAVISLGSVPSTVPASIPGGVPTPLELVLQEIALHPSSGAGNASNRVNLTFK